MTGTMSNVIESTIGNAIVAFAMSRQIIQIIGTTANALVFPFLLRIAAIAALVFPIYLGIASWAFMEVATTWKSRLQDSVWFVLYNGAASAVYAAHGISAGATAVACCGAVGWLLYSSRVAYLCWNQQPNAVQIHP